MLGAQGAFPHLKIHFGGPSGGPKKKKKHMLQRNHRTKERRRSFTTITTTTQPVSQLPTIESSYRWTPYLSVSLSRETTSKNSGNLDMI
jgi:hypothetical protein